MHEDRFCGVLTSDTEDDSPPFLRTLPFKSLIDKWWYSSIVHDCWRKASALNNPCSSCLRLVFGCQHTQQLPVFLVLGDLLDECGYIHIFKTDTHISTKIYSF